MHQVFENVLTLLRNTNSYNSIISNQVYCSYAFLSIIQGVDKCILQFFLYQINLSECKTNFSKIQITFNL